MSQAGSPNVTGQQLQNTSGHPGSVILGWWEQAPKDSEGYAVLSDLVDFLNSETQVRGPAFLLNASRPSWREKYGFAVEFHCWKPNKIRIERSDGPEPTEPEEAQA
jgi:hypothetical protein